MRAILSWNVNGLRAIYKKGFVDWVRREQLYLVGITLGC